jgi:serine/threonine-protein kinase
MASAPTKLLPRTLEHFEVLEELGQGAASRILHIRDSESMMHYAMKVVIRRTAEEQKFLDQAKHEFDIAQKLDHPSLLKVYDIRLKRRWFRVREVRTLLEYVNGQTLEQLPNLSVPLLAAIFAEVAQAVSYMHRRDVFHADLKPNNIMVANSGQVKVIDFGLAWERGQAKNRVQGTIGYLAPEQMRDRMVTEATDIYNLGATMYRMLTGRSASGTPAAGSGNFIASQGILVPAHELNPKIPFSLDELVSRCCATKPRKRPESMAAVAEDLGAIMQELKISREDLPELRRRCTRPTD